MAKRPPFSFVPTVKPTRVDDPGHMAGCDPGHVAGGGDRRPNVKRFLHIFLTDVQSAGFIMNFGGGLIARRQGSRVLGIQTKVDQHRPT